MKDLIKKYIEKGYEPTFYRMMSRGGIIDYFPVRDYDDLPAEKLELYLMRDWLEEEKNYYIELLSIGLRWGDY